MATIDLFYKSYRLDFDWLYKSLQSVKKYVTGYNEIHIVIPIKDAHLFKDENVPSGFKCRVHLTAEYGDGYLFQQWEKMRAHTYCKSDYIFYMDSDCFFTKQTDLNEYLIDGKPEILYTHYSKVGDAICWKAATERFMNTEVEYEFMRRLPMMYHRSTIEKIYNLCPFLEDLIMQTKGFSEFNAIGAWAFMHEKDKYRFTNTDNWKFVENPAIQLWSWDRGKESEEDKIKQILGE